MPATPSLGQLAQRQRLVEMLGAPGQQPLRPIQPDRDDRPGRPRHCAVSPGSFARSNSSGGRPPPKCTYLNSSVRMTARLHWRESMPKCRSAVALRRSSGNRTPNARRRASPSASLPSRNGSSERPSRCGGGVARRAGRATVGTMSTASVKRSTLRPAALPSARVADDQRDVVAAVEEAALAQHEMVAHHLGMVRGQDDDRVVPAPPPSPLARCGRAARRPPRSCRNRVARICRKSSSLQSRTLPFSAGHGISPAAAGRMIVVEIGMALAPRPASCPPGGRPGHRAGSYRVL